jgi:hypothetical protein
LQPREIGGGNWYVVIEVDELVEPRDDVDGVCVGAVVVGSALATAHSAAQNNRKTFILDPSSNVADEKDAEGE